MSLVAEFSVPAEAFCLGEALDTVPNATVEFDRLVAHPPDHVMPFIWVLNTDQDTFDAALADDPTVETAAVTDFFEDALLYQVAWTDVVGERLQAILNHEGVVLEARGSENEWRLLIRFGTRDHFEEFREHFEQFGEIVLHQLTSPQTPGKGQYGVSPEQRDALLAAYDAGYYETPSEVTGEELAQDLGITQQAVSQRVRRGVTALIENTIARHREN